MTLEFFGQDNEFTFAYGDEVNSDSHTSSFHDPAETTNLVIKPKPGDPEPRLFEVGDVYDMSITLEGSRYEAQDLVVVRSDAAPGGGGIIVFEGRGPDGQIGHLLWTPGFDLQTWYDQNTSNDNEAKFWTSDQNGSYTHGYMCFAAEALIAGPHGPMRAGDIEPGDRVDTFDRGMQTVRWVGRMPVRGQGDAAPIRFAPGAIGNDAPLRLSPQHRVLLRSERAELLFCAPEVLVPAKALVNGGTIRPAPCDTVTYVHLLLDRHEVLWADGALCESLYLGDQALALLDPVSVTDPDRRMIEGLRRMSDLHSRPARPLLTMAEARALLNHTPPLPASRPVLV